MSWVKLNALNGVETVRKKQFTFVAGIHHTVHWNVNSITGMLSTSEPVDESKRNDSGAILVSKQLDSITSCISIWNWFVTLIDTYIYVHLQVSRSEAYWTIYYITTVFAHDVVAW